MSAGAGRFRTNLPQASQVRASTCSVFASSRNGEPDAAGSPSETNGPDPFIRTVEALTAHGKIGVRIARETEMESIASPSCSMMGSCLYGHARADPSLGKAASITKGTRRRPKKARNKRGPSRKRAYKATHQSRLRQRGRACFFQSASVRTQAHQALRFPS
jgi:hypothetical protein